jgi:hypothetical protein
MTNLLTVQDPDESASEVATETRALLQAWADRYLPAVQEDSIQALGDEEIKQIRGLGASQLSSAQAYLSAMAALKPVHQFGNLLLALTRGTRVLYELYDKEVEPRKLSHTFEGLVKEFHKQFFQAGMKWNLHAEYLACISMQVPNSTSGYVDRIFWNQTGSYDVAHRGVSVQNVTGCHTEGMWRPTTDSVVKATRARFESIGDWLAVSAQVHERADRKYWLEQLASIAQVGAVLHYVDVDGPWVAGFLTVDDACRLRFRRVRLGAYLAEHGLSDEDVRARVEKAKQQVAAATFEAHPNDTLWEDLYTSGPSSCMSDSARCYETWADIHPTDAYASSYHGAGDNGLALLISRDGSGSITGRGILNLQKGTIVRWYGDAVAERVLRRQGVNVSHRGSFEGSWLALIQKGSRFIHPYVDGDLSYGMIEDGRVYIVEDGELCIQETGGSAYIGETHYCIDTDCEVAEDECTYQPISGNYISDECDSWRCPIIDEYCSSPRTVILHGVQVDISAYVYYNTDAYLTKVSTQGWHNAYTIDDEDIRNRFFDEQGIGEDEDEDEEAA